jgi:monofunctional biosynthetic peptidoglycan transglycosylase
VFVLGSVAIVLPLRWVDPPTTAFMLQDDSGRRPLLHEHVNWSAVGTAFPLAVVAAEDQKFAQHHGLDLEAIRTALAAAGDGGRLRGASTITQQLVKNLYLSPSRSLWRKAAEAWLALVADACLGKRRLLELYVNVVELGPGIYGVGAASRHYFGKRPAALRDAEAALLAAVLPNPRVLRVDRPSSYLRTRQAWILSHVARLRREGWLTRLGS